MSFDPHMARRALNNTSMAPVVRLLWRVLVDYAGPDGRCWPSVETLAADVGVSERHAQRALRELERRGFVVTERRVGKPSIYTLTPDTDVTRPPTRVSPLPPTPTSPSGDTGVTSRVTPESPTPDLGVTSRTTRVSPELSNELSKNGEEERRARDPASPPVPDLTDSEAETVCPLDLVARARERGVLTQLADGLRVPLVSVEAKADEFVAYWTLGAGAGQKRRHWLRRLRKDIHEAAKANRLPAPGAIEHQGGMPGGGPSPVVAAFLARTADR